MTNRIQTLSIRGLLYQVYLLDNDTFDKLYKDSDAVTTLDRRLVFKPEKVTLPVVIHEITHAYIKGSLLSSVEEMTLGDFEECVCEVMAEFGEELVLNSKRVFSALEKGIRDGEKRRKKRIKG